MNVGLLDGFGFGIYLQYIIPVVTIFIYFTTLYFVAEKKKNYSIVDIGWGAGFVLVAIVSGIWNFLLTGTLTLTTIFIMIVTAIWGIRLSSHIYKRNHGKPEDFRYVAMRERYAKMKYPKFAAYLRIFVTQALFMFIVSLPITIGIARPILQSALLSYVLLGLGALIWIIGFIFESVGDAQLAKFIKNPANKGKIMDQGLWRYTRHPNYFGESAMWFGVGIAASSVSFGFIGLISPIVITYLLVFVSGVPLLEKAMMERPGFAEYASKTSVFIPWFPKK